MFWARFSPGDQVRINEGTFENFEGQFENFEGQIDEVNEETGRVTVIIKIFGRETPVELEPRQIDRREPPATGSSGC